MSRRFTLITVVLTAVVAFLVGAIFAGSGTQPSVVAGPGNKNAAIGPVSKLVQSAIPAPLVNFADIVDRINPAASTSTPRPGARSAQPPAPGTPGPLDGPERFRPRLGSTRRAW